MAIIRKTFAAAAAAPQGKTTMLVRKPKARGAEVIAGSGGKVVLTPSRPKARLSIHYGKMPSTGLQPSYPDYSGAFAELSKQVSDLRSSMPSTQTSGAANVQSAYAPAIASPGAAPGVSSSAPSDAALDAQTVADGLAPDVPATEPAPKPTLLTKRNLMIAGAVALGAFLLLR